MSIITTLLSILGGLVLVLLVVGGAVALLERGALAAIAHGPPMSPGHALSAKKPVDERLEHIRREQQLREDRQTELYNLERDIQQAERLMELAKWAQKLRKRHDAQRAADSNYPPDISEVHRKIQSDIERLKQGRAA